MFAAIDFSEERSSSRHLSARPNEREALSRDHKHCACGLYLCEPMGSGAHARESSFAAWALVLPNSPPLDLGAESIEG